MPYVFLLIPLLEILGLFGFTYVAAVTDEQSVRYLPFAVAAIVVIWLAFKNVKSLTPKQITISSVLVSLAFVGCFQILGLIVPGLAKDVDLLSIANLLRLSAVFAVAFAGHFALFATMKAISKQTATDPEYPG